MTCKECRWFKKCAYNSFFDGQPSTPYYDIDDGVTDYVEKKCEYFVNGDWRKEKGWKPFEKFFKNRIK